MAWNPSPKVAAARDIGNMFKADQVIVVMINKTPGMMEAVSFGKTKALCDDAKTLSDAAFDAVYETIRKRGYIK